MHKCMLDKISQTFDHPVPNKQDKCPDKPYKNRVYGENSGQDFTKLRKQDGLTNPLHFEITYAGMLQTY
uniref:Uncharacterized protein n=1 Tax=Rhizophora mucronata TaxID=61149 RepID=A0A2P2Q8V4_RHIMU